MGKLILTSFCCSFAISPFFTMEAKKRCILLSSQIHFTTSQQLPSRLKQLRETRSWTGTYVAEQLHIVQQTYSNYETGIRTPNIDLLCSIADLYGISLDDLLMHTPKNEKHADSITDKANHPSAPADNPCTDSFFVEYGSYDLNCRLTELCKNFSLLCKDEQEDISQYVRLRADRMRKSE